MDRAQGAWSSATSSSAAGVSLSPLPRPDGSLHLQLLRPHPHGGWHSCRSLPLQTGRRAGEQPAGTTPDWSGPAARSPAPPLEPPFCISRWETGGFPQRPGSPELRSSSWGRSCARRSRLAPLRTDEFEQPLAVLLSKRPINPWRCRMVAADRTLRVTRRGRPNRLVRPLTRC